MFSFKILAEDGAARVGEMVTSHGTVSTPVFMPVGTHGAVKSLAPFELERLGSPIILGNTYHLYLRPGDDLIARLGGLHALMQWKRPLLTDSGGFQVFSLGERGMAGNSKTALRQVAEEGITFRSHLDGSSHLFTPERSIEIQQNLGADIIMAFDQPVYGLSTAETVREAMQRTQRWLKRSADQWKKGDTAHQALFGIVQGGTHQDLHRQSAEFTVAQDLPGNAIGGLSVGEGKQPMWEAVSSINEILPKNKPRYFMGLGEPYDLMDATARGVDMYDCVAPTRLARHGAVWQVVGEEKAVAAFYTKDTTQFLSLGLPLTFERWNLKNNRFSEDSLPLQSYALTLTPESGHFSRAALHHYLAEGEMLGFRLLSFHNIEVLQLVTYHLQQAIRQGSIRQFMALFPH